MIPSLHFMDGTTITEFAKEIRHKIILQEEKMVLSDDPRCDLEDELSALEDVERAIGTVIGYMNAEFEASMNKIVEKKREVVEKKKTIRELWTETPNGERIKCKDYFDLVEFIGQNHKLLFGDSEYVGECWTYFGCWDNTVEQSRKIIEGKVKKAKELEEYDRRAWNR